MLGLAMGISTSLRICHFVAPNGERRFLNVLGHLPKAEVGEAHHGRQTEYDGGDDARGLAGPEEGDHGNQIDECGHALHEVQDRPRHREHPVAARAPHPEGNPHRDADEGGGAEQGHRRHAPPPVAENRQVGERGSSEYRDARPRQAPGGDHDDRHHHRPRGLDEHRFQPFQDHPDCFRNALEEDRVVRGSPVEAAVDPGGDRIVVVGARHRKIDDEGGAAPER